MGLLEHPEHSTLEKAKLGKLQTQLLLLSLPSKKKSKNPKYFQNICLLFYSVSPLVLIMLQLQRHLVRILNIINFVHAKGVIKKQLLL